MNLTLLLSLFVAENKREWGLTNLTIFPLKSVFPNSNRVYGYGFFVIKAIHYAATCPLSLPREASRSGQMPKAWNLGERISPLPQIRHLFVAFGGGWEGAEDKPQNPLEVEFFKTPRLVRCGKDLISNY